MKLIRSVLCILAVALLVACGGGGGNPGTSSSGNGSGQGGGSTDEAKYPALTASLQDQTGAKTSEIIPSSYVTLRALLTDPSGNPLADQIVNVTGDDSKVKFPQGSSALTNSSGVATIAIARAELFATGAGSLTLTYNYKEGLFSKYADGSAAPATEKLISAFVNYQVSPANVSLTALNVGVGSLAAYGTRPVSVQVNVNGSPTTSPLQVAFSASCGTVSPVTVATSGSGIAQASFSAVNSSLANDQGCSGSNVVITASTQGADVLTGSFNVQLAPATNLLFQSAQPARIYLADSGGATQSMVKFRLVNSSNSPLQGQEIHLELEDLAGGIPRLTFGSVGNVSALTLATDANGEVSVPVFSGTVPTSAVVRASLKSDSAVTTTSSVLAVASGRAAQARASLTVDAFSIEGFNIDGVQTGLTMRLADRQGNPVPDGTAVNFVTEGGLISPPTCITVDSTCSVQLRSQNPRPTNGLVSILAYAPGEEDFVDTDGDNVYSAGETFQDLGNAFRDDRDLGGGGLGTWVGGYFSVPRAGTLACVGNNYLGKPDSCDGAWGAVDVRRQLVVNFATSWASVTSPVWVQAPEPAYVGSPNVANTLRVTVKDLNGNSMPTGSSLSVTAVDKSPNTPTKAGSDAGLPCAVVSQSISVTPNTIYPVPLQANLKDCIAGDQIQISVTSPEGNLTSLYFTVP